MGSYRISNDAIDDLSNIWNYSADQWSENQANKYYKELKSAFEKISENPESGRNFEEMDKIFFGYMINRHIVFYRKHSVEGIEIVRILHERMDIAKQMLE